MTQEYKLVLMGNGGVGKSAIALRFMHGYFTTDYDPTIEDSYRKSIVVDGEISVVDLLDTAGQEEYNSIRDAYMRVGQGFILTYSVIDRTSFLAIETQFRNQIMRVRDRNNFPMVLVGNKCDLERSREVPTEEGERLAQTWNSPFLETSALQGKNCEEVFLTCIREIRKERQLHHSGKLGNKAKKEKCEIL